MPFQFSRYVRQRLAGGSVLQASAGVTVTDLDGNVLYDLTGSYGVNLFGYDFYKAASPRAARVRDLGPVLGAYHPVVAYNVERLRADLRAGRGFVPHVRHRSGDAGGTACPLSHGAPQSGALLRRLPRLVGATCSPASAILDRARNLHADGNVRATLQVLRTRTDIACVLVNPLQALHPNAGCTCEFLAGRQRPPRRISTVQAYTRWLQQLRDGVHASAASR